MAGRQYDSEPPSISTTVNINGYSASGVVWPVSESGAPRSDGSCGVWVSAPAVCSLDPHLTGGCGFDEMCNTTGRNSNDISLNRASRTDIEVEQPGIPSGKVEAVVIQFSDQM